MSNRPRLKRQKPFKRISFNHAAFEKVFDDAATLIIRSQDKRRLNDVECFKNTLLNSASLDKLCELIKDVKFPAGMTIMTEGEKTEAALYLVRSGKCKVTSKCTLWDDTIVDDGFFGEDHMTMHVGRKNPDIDNLTIQELSDLSESIFSSTFDDGCEFFAKYTVEVVEDTICGVLSLNDCRLVIDTASIGQTPKHRISMYERVSNVGDLTRYSVLGQGGFGQVWLVSASDKTELETPYALKIQSKEEIDEQGKTTSVGCEKKEIMSELDHPFLLQALKTFQDENLIYMLFRYIPGGELFHRVHTDKWDGLPESEARFYAAGILEALSYMHRKKIIYRDLKSENVLITTNGYPVITDFGFAKRVSEIKYTRCGSPCYMAPEVVMINVEYGLSADHWSFGCLIHEMIVGNTPFVGHPTELALYRAICSGYSNIDPDIEDKKDVLDLVQRLLVVNPSKRIGSLSGGVLDIFNHTWFDEIDFALLINRAISPPWVPTIKHRFDVSYFEKTNSYRDLSKGKIAEFSITKRVENNT